MRLAIFWITKTAVSIAIYLGVESQKNELFYIAAVHFIFFLIEMVGNEARIGICVPTRHTLISFIDPKMLVLKRLIRDLPQQIAHPTIFVW